MSRLRHYLYKVQHKIAITRQESVFLVVCLVLFSTGLVAQYVQEPHHPAPDAHALAEQRFQERVQELAEAQEQGQLEEASDEGKDPSSPDSHTPDLIELNSASERELQALPGIGPALAERIILYRDAVGYFRREDELLEVSGIGPRTLETLAPLIHLDEPSTE